MAIAAKTQQKRQRLALRKENKQKPNFDKLFVEAVNELQPQWASKRLAKKATPA